MVSTCQPAPKLTVVFEPYLLSKPPPEIAEFNLNAPKIVAIWKSRGKIMRANVQLFNILNHGAAMFTAG
ncbi:MAG: hypothetical protein QXS15_06030 [Candidatus Jordarchaeales archaeon]